jgi:hypothetical protein
MPSNGMDDWVAVQAAGLVAIGDGHAARLLLARSTSPQGSLAIAATWNLGERDDAISAAARGSDLLSAPDQHLVRWLAVEGQHTLRDEHELPGGNSSGGAAVALEIARLVRERQPAEAIGLARQLQQVTRAASLGTLAEGTSSLMAGSSRAAVRAFDRVVQADPRSLAGWIGLVIARAQANDWRGALDAGSEALRLDSPNGDAWWVLRRTLARVTTPAWLLLWCMGFTAFFAFGFMFQEGVHASRANMTTFASVTAGVAGGAAAVLWQLRGAMSTEVLASTRDLIRPRWRDGLLGLGIGILLAGVFSEDLTRNVAALVFLAALLGGLAVVCVRLYVRQSIATLANMTTRALAGLDA